MLRLVYVVFIGFTNEEYLIALVDFIAPCGGTKGQRRRTLRIPPSLSSGLQLFHPGRSLRRNITANRDGYRDFVCANPVSCGRLRFRIFGWACVTRFSFVLMEDRRCLCGLNRSLRITANREGLFQSCLACIQVLLND